MTHIVIIGGGAGGLELAKYVAASKKNKITLVDQAPTHLWKPLLHEVAAGTLNAYADELNYLSFATQHQFEFCLGTFVGINRAAKTLELRALINEAGVEIVPKRWLSYEILIIAVGSITNDFEIPGVSTHCILFDARSQADHFQRLLIQQFMRLDYCNRTHLTVDKPLTIAIIGGGATGVELVAELRSAIHQAIDCGMALKPKDIALVLIESYARLLAPLSEDISAWVLNQLYQLNVTVFLNETVSEIQATGIVLQSGKYITTDLCVWAAGIKAPKFLTTLDGLAVNKLNQLCVKPTLQTTEDNTIFALGDCATCPQGLGKPQVPARAQAAHEQARFLAKNLQRYLKNKPLLDFHYRDYGSLISLGQEKSIGRLQSGPLKITLQGKIAKMAYLILYKSHQVALYGIWQVILLTLANQLNYRVKPRFKCH